MHRVQVWGPVTLNEEGHGPKAPALLLGPLFSFRREREAETNSGLDLVSGSVMKGLSQPGFPPPGWGEGERREGVAGAGMCDKIKALSLPGPHLGFT